MRVGRAFALLVLAQASHSVEEYVGGLYDVFAPAGFVSSLVSNDLSTGFLVVNVTIVLLGAWCWAVPVRAGWPSAHGVAWVWAVVELLNGAGHVMLALSRGGYFPGVLTAPLLLAGGGWLVTALVARDT